MLPAIDQGLGHLTTNGLCQLLASAKALDSLQFQLLFIQAKCGFHRKKAAASQIPLLVTIMKHFY